NTVSGNGFTGSRFPNDRQRLIGIERDVDSLYSVNGACTRREIDLEIADGQERFHVFIRGSSRSRTQSPNRLKLKIAQESIRPGKSEVHQLPEIKSLAPSATMMPHSGV